MAQEQSLFPLDDFQLTEINFSKLDLFLQCKFRYKSKHIDKLLRQDQRSTFYLSVGRSLHNLLEKMGNYSSRQQKIEETELKKLLNDSWISEGFSNNQDRDFWYSKSWDLINRINNNASFFGNVILTEETFKQQIDNLLIKSRVDRVDKISETECEIIDYKVGGEIVSHEKAEASLQWAFHFFASQEKLKTTYGLDIRKITFYYLVADEKVSFEPNDSSIKDGWDQIMSITENIDKENAFPPKLNAYCTDCRFDKICPAIKDLRKRGISLEDALGY